jgi:hypothetical protein
MSDHAALDRRDPVFVRPGQFAGFLAKVGPGPRFELENEPVAGPIWQPKRFEVHVAASVLFFERDSTTVDTFRDYRSEATQD